MSQNLLMIEDDARLARMVSEYLGQSGFEVSHAGTGQSGLTDLQDNPPDLVILDLMLPDMDGLEAVSYTHLRAHETGRNLVCRLLLEKKKNRHFVSSWSKN